MKQWKEIWKRDYSKPSPLGIPSGYASLFIYSPVIYNDKIVILGGASPREFLLVIDKNTGDPIWKSEVIGGDYAETCSEQPLIINGRIYLAASSKENYEKNGDLQAGIWVWDVDTGKVIDRISFDAVAEPIIGKYRTMHPAVTSLAQDGSNIYGVTQFTESTYRTYIFCYDTLRKKFTWFAPIGEEGFNSPSQKTHIAVNENFVAVCMVGNQWMEKEPQFFIKVFDKASHKPLWQNITKTVQSENPILTFMIIAIHNNKLYAMLFDKRFVCFDMETGKEIWSFKDEDWQSEWWNKWNNYGDCFNENDIVATMDVVYFNAGNAIYAFDPETGKLLWRKVAKKENLFINMMPVEKGLIVKYQDFPSGYDTPQGPVISELWK